MNTFMENFLKRKRNVVEVSPSGTETKEDRATMSHIDVVTNPKIMAEAGPNEDNVTLPQKRVEINLESLPADPGLRPSIWNYSANERDRVRRSYLEKGPCQPKFHDFPQTDCDGVRRRFGAHWFNKYQDWLEYSVDKDCAYCLYCYLFKLENNQGGGDSFVGKGFNNWKKPNKFDSHVGKSNSLHNQAKKKCQDLMNQSLTASVSSLFTAKKSKDRIAYRIRLTATISCIRLLLRQGLPLRGHDESENSINKGNYLEFFHWYAKRNEEVRKVSFENAPQNATLVSSDIQKDICYAAAAETTRAIIKDMGDAFFTILVDESRDISMKEQMAVVLRYVNKEGKIVERFLGIEHVPNTTSAALKMYIDKLLARHNLSMSRLRGQGYDGASNMRGDIKGLKTLILQENPCAYYVHCFAHQLQLALVSTAKHHYEVLKLFEITLKVLNVVGASAMRQDILKAKQYEKVTEALKRGELISGRGLNQETNIRRPCDTRWSSHYVSLLRLSTMFSSVIEVLELIEDDIGVGDQRVEAGSLLQILQSFEFVFTLHLMIRILGITNELSQALQRKEQEIDNAMRLVQVAKKRLQSLRDDGWDNLLVEVSSFCSEHELVVPDMLEQFAPSGRLKRKTKTGKTNLVYFRIELFYVVLDKQLMDLNSRFPEATTDLLRFLGCLNPIDSFASFDKEKLIRFAQFYPKDFPTPYDLKLLGNQLETYIIDVRGRSEFSALRGIADLAKKMVETRTHIVYPLVYLLVKLALTLPVATAGVERIFSGMNDVKDELRNRMSDDLLNACLVTYIEKEVFDGVDDESIIQHFQTMKDRREKL